MPDTTECVPCAGQGVMANYQLGPVEPFVERVAYILGPMFGVTTVYGHRDQGSVPDSDHPKGRALDFMISSTAVGDALAGFAIKNARILGVKYIVWNRRSWNPERGTWQAYTATTNPHTDHVHISFKAGSDSDPLNSFASGFASGVTGGLLDVPGQVIDAVSPFYKIADRLGTPAFLRRIATGVFGAAFVIAGLLFIARRPIGTVVGTVGGAVGDIVGTAIQGAAFGVGAGATGGLGKTKERPVSPAPVSEARPGPYPPKMLPSAPATAIPTTSALPPEIYAPTSTGGTYTVTTARGRAANPTEYRPPGGGSLIDLAGKRNPTPPPKPKKSKKGQFNPSVSAPMRQQPYGGE